MNTKSSRMKTAVAPATRFILGLGTLIPLLAITPVNGQPIPSVPGAGQQGPPLRLAQPVPPPNANLAQPPAVEQKPGIGEEALTRKVASLVEAIYQSELELKVQKRRSKIIRLKENVYRVAVADPTILELVAFGTREVEIIGKDVGSTSVTLWMGNEQAPQILSLLVTVQKDEAVEAAKRLEFGELQDMINELFPNSKIQLIPIADKLILRGQARDEQEALQILALVRSKGTSGGAGGGGAAQQVSGSAAASPFPDSAQTTNANVVNMMTIPGEKQVMLKVRIAEIKRSALRSLGTDLDFDVGDFAFDSALLAAGQNNFSFSGTFNGDNFNLALRALETNGNAKILAEPNLTTISGQSANFISGGEFAVPTVVGVGGAQASTTTFKGFGTQLQFTPTVLDRDRIRLTVAPTFSTLNRTNTVQGIFGLDTRSVATTVDLREGQVFAIAGLIQEQQRGDVSRIPGVGRVPYLNTLFSNKSITRDETELIILVSPELVHPLEPENAPAILPGMDVTEPDDLEFFFHGNIEGRPMNHHRSTVWPLYQNRLDRIKRCEETQRSNNYFLFGPNGFSN